MLSTSDICLFKTTSLIHSCLPIKRNKVAYIYQSSSVLLSIQKSLSEADYMHFTTRLILLLIEDFKMEFCTFNFGLTTNLIFMFCFSFKQFLTILSNSFKVLKNSVSLPYLTRPFLEISILSIPQGFHLVAQDQPSKLYFILYSNYIVWLPACIILEIGQIVGWQVPYF